MFGCWYKFRKAKCWFNDFLVRHGKSGQKWAWAFSSWNLIICCISRMSLWIEVIFSMLKVKHHLQLVRLISYSLSLTFECWGSVAVVLVVIFVICYIIIINWCYYIIIIINIIAIVGTPKLYFVKVIIISTYGLLLTSTTIVGPCSIVMGLDISGDFVIYFVKCLLPSRFLPLL